MSVSGICKIKKSRGVQDKIRPNEGEDEYIFIKVDLRTDALEKGDTPPQN